MQIFSQMIYFSIFAHLMDTYIDAPVGGVWVGARIYMMLIIHSCQGNSYLTMNILVIISIINVFHLYQ